MTPFEQLQKNINRGWQTWNNASVFSYVHMPEKMGFKLGLKDYKYEKSLPNALIGSEAADGIVTPYAHAYDNSYTFSRLEWLDIEITVETACADGDQVVIVTPVKLPPKAPTLIVESISLWNSSAILTKKDSTLTLQKDDTAITVQITAPENTEYFTWCNTPYLSAALSEPIGISTGKARTLEEIRNICAARKQKWADNMNKYGKFAETYNAMQTCQAWDTIFNPEYGYPTTTVSRIWNNEWGGYVLFCWDTYFGALMQALDNKELAYCNAIAITRTLRGCGFVPNYTAQNNVKSFDRSQPPVGSMTCLEIYKKYQEKWFLEEVFEDLFTWNEWFMKKRTGKNGLLAWGSNPYKGVTGHVLETQGVGKFRAAAYESGLDNSPMFDDMPFDTERCILLLEDVGLTGLYIKDCYSLAEIAAILGYADKAALLLDRAHTLEDKLETLWEDDFGMYLCRREDTGAFQYRISPFHFHALFSKKAGKEHAERIVKDHFYNPQEFWGDYIMPAIARNDPAYPDQDYWRGRIWAPMNYLVYMALSEYASESELVAQAVKDLSEKSEKLILKEWLEMGHVHENYDGDTGDGCGIANSDRFYHWGGLLSFITLHYENYFN